MDRTLSNKRKFMHWYAAFLQPIVFHPFFFVFTQATSLSPIGCFCSETVEARWEKLAAILDFGDTSHFGYTAPENDPYMIL